MALAVAARKVKGKAAGGMAAATDKTQRMGRLAAVASVVAAAALAVAAASAAARAKTRTHRAAAVAGEETAAIAAKTEAFRKILPSLNSAISSGRWRVKP